MADEVPWVNLESKSFWMGARSDWALSWTYGLKLKNNSYKKCQASKYFTQIAKFITNFLLNLITKILPFLFKLGPVLTMGLDACLDLGA